MSISVCVLGSGSSGNCTLLVLRDGSEEKFILIDAGLSPRRTRGLLAEFGVQIDRLAMIVLTHLDSDHFRPSWVNITAKYGIQICLHESHACAAPNEARALRHLRTMNGSLQLGPRSRLRSIHLPHDKLGTFGFVIEHEGRRLGYATDLGHVPNELAEQFCDLDALAIESNYDHDMEMASARPWFLKNRIMGDYGHLSNDQAFEAVLKIADQSRLSHIVLLHLSRQCNHPRLVQKLYAARAPHLLNRLTISSQHAPTPMLHVDHAIGAASGSLFAAAR